MAEIVRLPGGRIPLARPWTPTRVSDILEVPPPPLWAWDGRIMRGQVTLLGGEGKVGKSMIVQQLLSSAALGLPCLGRHTERCRTFGYFCEDSDYWLKTRQFKINEELGVLPPDYDDRYYWQSATDCILAELKFGKIETTPEWDQLWRVIDDEQSELIAIDTARAVFGGNENRADHVTPFVRKLQAKAAEKDRAIILVIHPPTGNSGKGYAGTGAWFNSARGGLSLERPREYDPYTDTPPYDRILRGLGANYGGGRASAKIRWVPERQVFASVEEEPLPARVLTPGAKDVLDQEMIRLLYQLRTNGALIPADVTLGRSLPQCYRKLFDRRMSLNDLNASYDRLLLSNQLVRVNVHGKCYVRPRDGRAYPEETTWRI